MSYLVDQAIALRIIYLLVTPINKYDAFKYGIIDKDGTPIKKISALKTNAEKESYTMLHRLVLRIKKMLAILPAGRSMMMSIAAAYMLVKENTELDPDTAMQLFAEQLNHIEEYGLDPEVLDEVTSLLEDGEIANVTAGIEPNTPRIKPKKIKVKLVSGPLSQKFITPSVNESTIYYNTSTLQMFMVE